MAVQAFIKAFFSTNLIFPFDMNCTTTSCDHCTIYVQLDIWINCQNGFFMFMTFLESIKHAFWSRRQENRNNRIKLFVLRFIVVMEMLTIFFDAVTFDGSSAVHQIVFGNNTQYFVCYMKAIAGRDDFSSIAFAITMLTYLVLGLIFVFKTFRIILFHTKSLAHKSREKLNVLKLVMRKNIKHMLLCLTIMVLSIASIMTNGYLIKHTIISTLVIGELIYMLFDFGDDKYEFFFGCVDQLLFDIWRRKVGIADIDTYTPTLDSVVCMKPQLSVIPELSITYIPEIPHEVSAYIPSFTENTTDAEHDNEEEDQIERKRYI
eukprot:208657_1